MRRVLVAGATGYLGGFVAQELEVRGHFVRALAR
ncbi:MAG: NmrA family NAD(P)-binding protein, partial [Thermoanaerobaculia bacterium]